MSTARTWIRICVLIVSLVPAIAFARLDASVDSTAISAADTIRLTLRADSTNITGEPNLDALSAQFDVLDTQRNSQFQSINGQVSAWTTWTLTLKPKHTGTLTIPPISVGNDTSQPISITVKDLDPQLKSAIARTVFFETTYEPKQVYVQSQIIITRRLFYLGGAQLYGNMPDAPDIPGAMVESLGDASRSTAIRDGRQYGVIEQRFAAFPERSGTLKIPTTSVTGSVRLDDGMGGRRVGIDVTSEPLSIAVLPIPPDYPRDTPWLPASDVELVQDWPGEPARGLATGTPSQRTLIVRADGNTASAIPPLKMRLPDSIKAYPEPPKMNETQGRSGIIGTRTESTSLVATQPGSLTLPEVSVTWFDTVHRQVKIASLPARTINVSGAPTEARRPTQRARAAPPEQPGARNAASAPIGNPAVRVPVSSAAPHTAATINPWFTGLFLALLVGCGYAAWRDSRRAGIGNDARTREADAYRELRRACDGGTPQRIRRALDAWLPRHYDAPLADAARYFTLDADAHDAVNALNAKLYQRDAGSFDSKPLQRCVDAARAKVRQSVHADVLPALYPAARSASA